MMRTNGRPLISFVVLCYNTERYARECIESILAQQGSYDFEIIAVEDCSTDGTRGVLRAISDPRFRVIEHGTNRGHIAAINEALPETQGVYVARIDSDDRYKPQFLMETVPTLERCPEVGLVYGNAAIIDHNGVQNSPDSDTRHGGKDFKGGELIPLLAENFICAPTVIARREAWLRYAPVRDGLAFSDWYFSVMMARDYEFYYLNRVLADYRVHAGNLHSRTIRDRTEETSIFWMLDRVFALEEQDPQLEREKQMARRSIYASHYWTLANKYFGAGMNEDARRCFELTLEHSPGYFRSTALLRRLAATYISRKWYERAKAVWSK